MFGFNDSFLICIFFRVNDMLKDGGEELTDISVHFFNITHYLVMLSDVLDIIQ